MNIRARIASLLSLAILLFPAVASADYIESINGDLSGNRLSPSSLILVSGSNIIAGSTVVGDLDYLTFNVPTGYVLAHLNLVNFVSADDLAFMAIQSGTTITEDPSSPNVANLLGWGHFGTTVPVDFLPILGSGAGAIGFSGPLAAGNYTLWIQQTGPQLVEYRFDAVTTSSVPVPEPSSAGLLVAGLTGVAVLYRRRR